MPPRFLKITKMAISRARRVFFLKILPPKSFLDHCLHIQNKNFQNLNIFSRDLCVFWASGTQKTPRDPPKRYFGHKKGYRGLKIFGKFFKKNFGPKTHFMGSRGPKTCVWAKKFFWPKIFFPELVRFRHFGRFGPFGWKTDPCQELNHHLRDARTSALPPWLLHLGLVPYHLTSTTSSRTHLGPIQDTSRTHLGRIYKKLFIQKHCLLPGPHNVLWAKITQNAPTEHSGGP